jgi:hypothetical protein
MAGIGTTAQGEASGNISNGIGGQAHGGTTANVEGTSGTGTTGTATGALGTETSGQTTGSTTSGVSGASTTGTGTTGTGTTSTTGSTTTAQLSLDHDVIELHGMTVPVGAGAGTPGEVNGSGGFQALLPVASAEIHQASLTTLAELTLAEHGVGSVQGIAHLSDLFA